MVRPKIFNGFLLILLVFMLGMAGLLLAPFFGVLLLAAVLAIVFYPLHGTIGRWTFLRKRPGLHALASDLTVLILFLLPVGLLVWAVVAESDALAALFVKSVAKVEAWLQQTRTLPVSWINRLPPWLSAALESPSDALHGISSKLAGPSVGLAARFGTQIARNTVQLLLHAALLVFALFFFFRDGEAWYREWNTLLPLPAVSKKRLDHKIHSTIIGVVRGSFITALAQSTVAVIGFALAGVPGSLLLGFLMFASTIIPAVGHALVWVPVSVYYLIAGAYGKAIFLTAWSLFVTGLIDNILRPFVVGSRLGMSVFWLFFGILGGLQLFGIKGVLLGPLIMTIIPVLFELYKDIYLNPSSLEDKA